MSMGSTSYISEASLNRLLRRADWRFLLPDPCPIRSRCDASGKLKEAVRAISNQLVEEPEAVELDLVVLSNPNPSKLRTAFHQLRLGGACYVEWFAPGRHATVLRRQLEGVGFENV